MISALPDKCVDQIWVSHFFEHLDDIVHLMLEFARFCVDDALVEVTVPHFSNPYFYSDPSHKRTFGLYSMSYFCDDRIHQRSVPKYGRVPVFNIIESKLIFKSIRPRYIRHAIKKIFELIFNSNTWLKEMYEELFCYVIPCYEIRYRLQKLIR